MASDKAFKGFLKDVAKRIKVRRAVLGLTQEDMIKFGFNYRHYQRIESGSHSLTLHTLYRVAQALKTNVHDLLKSV